MTVLAGKMHALGLYAGARRNLVVASVPFVSESMQLRAATRAEHKLTIAADVLANLDTKRSFEGLIDVTREAAESLGQAPTNSLARAEARSAASLGRSLLRAEPDVARERAETRRVIVAGLTGVKI